MNYIDENFKLNCEYNVYSIFDNVINLELNGIIYSIFNHNISKAPYSLILSNELFIEYKEKCLNNKKVFIDNIKANIFNCKMNIKLKSQNISLLEKYINSFKRQDSIFEEAFQNKRKEKNLENMIGLGLGLTPSGDDYIVGIMAGFYSKYNDKPKIFDDLIQYSKNRTNLISYNYLKNASNKLFKNEILEFMDDIENETKLKKLVSFGSSSGQDILYGIYDYLKGKYIIKGKA